MKIMKDYKNNIKKLRLRLHIFNATVLILYTIIYILVYVYFFKLQKWQRLAIEIIS